MNGERIATTMRRPAIVAVVWICALLVLTGTLTKMPGQWHRRDFSNYYESAWALRHGIDPYSTNLTPIGIQLGLETGGLLHASETPPFLLSFEPLTRLPPRTAFWTWTAINFSALAIAMYLLLAHRRGLSGRTAWLLAGLMLMWAPVNLNFYWGQSQLIVLALMAAAMRADRNYWSVAAATAPQTISVTGNAVSGSTDGTLLGGGPNCSTSVCSNNAQLAAYDLAQWAKSLYVLLPADTATVLCTPPVTANYPVGCSITVSWVERSAGINAQSSGPTASLMTAPSYTLYVEP